MHELSICDAISRAVLQRAEGRRVRTVRLQVGALRQVVPDTLVFCWSLAAVDPALVGSELEIEVVPGEVECRDCGVRSRLDRFVLRCAACEGPVTVVAGEDLVVVSMDVEPSGVEPSGVQPV